MIEVEIENFQSIVKASVQIEAFTALVGRSNIGKSAIVRAVKCALTGASGTDFVRHIDSCERRLKGNKKCRCKSSVTIRTPAMTMVWEKGDHDNRYLVTYPGKEPVLYDKVHRGTPEFLSPLFSTIKMGDHSELLQIADQFSPIFLLDQSGPAVAEVLSDVAKLDDINTAIGLVAKDLRTNTMTRNVREKDVTDLENSLRAYDGLDTVSQRSSAAQSDFSTIDTQAKSLSYLERTIQEQASLESSCLQLSSLLIKPLPDEAALKRASQSFGMVSGYLRELTDRVVAAKKLIGVDKVQVLDDTRLLSVSRQFGLLSSWLRKLVDSKVEIDRWKALSSLPVLDEQTISGTTKKLKEVRSFQFHQNTLEAIIERQLNALKPQDCLLPSELFGKLVEITRLSSKYASVVRTLESVRNELNCAEREENQVLEEFSALGLCPTCAQRIKPGESHELSV